MAWPKGRARPRKVGGDIPPEREQEAMEAVENAEYVDVPRDPAQPPADWRKGALLNVRDHHSYAPYVITLWPEEYDPEHPERCVTFTNRGECQDFVSRWYAAEHHDPRAR